jgi:hypothetical protein
MRVKKKKKYFEDWSMYVHTYTCSYKHNNHAKTLKYLTFTTNTLFTEVLGDNLSRCVRWDRR